MSDLTGNPPPLINPAILEKWNQLPLDKPVELHLTRQDWDNLFVSLISTQYALRFAHAALSSLARSAPDSAHTAVWQEIWNVQNNASDAHQRTVRFIETAMLRSKGGD